MVLEAVKLYPIPAGSPVTTALVAPPSSWYSISINGSANVFPGLS